LGDDLAERAGLDDEAQEESDEEGEEMLAWLVEVER